MKLRNNGRKQDYINLYQQTNVKWLVTLLNFNCLKLNKITFVLIALGIFYS